MSSLAPGARVRGLAEGATVVMVEVTPLGTGAYVRFRTEVGLTRSRTLTEAQLAELEVEGTGGPTLDADPAAFRLAFDALAIRYAHLLNPLLAVTSSNVAPLPHQVQAVYDHLLASHPQRFLLADDPGAGKTIMAGLYLKEAMARGWVRRCLIVAPGSLVEQWQDEMDRKFGLRFDIFERSLVDPRANQEDPLAHLPQLIVRLDQFARSETLMRLVSASTYDLAIVDEAHKLTARTWGSKLMKSKRFLFGERLRDVCSSLLLMTATPHNGKEADYQLFLSLLRDADTDEHVADATAAGLMRRLVKEQLVQIDGSPLFPERRANTVSYRLSPPEHDLYEDVSEYVREEMNKVSDEEEKRVVGFALLVLQRRLASSPEAILRSLARRHERLQTEALRVRAADERLADALAASFGLQVEVDLDDLSAAEAEALEDDGAAVATAARTIEELETEIAILERLVDKAGAVRDARVDAKWDALAELLASTEMYDGMGDRRKIIIFTEHRDTLEYLHQRLLEVLPDGTGIEVIHGAVSRSERRAAEVRFTRDPAASVLLATDAAGEGVNLQAAHLMVNYDIPWNPNRLEQRFGRIHRIGQRHVCHLWNLVAVDTREGDVFEKLLGKLEVQRAALGDQVFDVLGQVLTNANLGQLLTQALRGGADCEVESAVERVSKDLRQAVHERAASSSTLTTQELAVLRRDMGIARAASLQPEVVRDFALTAFNWFRGEITPHGAFWRVGHVPGGVREAGRAAGVDVRTRYDLVSFEADTAPTRMFEEPELVAPGHPLLAALVEAVDADLGSSLRRGATLEDDRSAADYDIVTVLLRGTDGAPVDVVTLRLAEGRAPERVATEIVTSLAPASALSDSSTDMTAAVDAALGWPTTHAAEVVAVAHVIGIASAQEAAAWHAARQSLRASLEREGVEPHDLVEAAPERGWDVMVPGRQGGIFFQAVPTGAIARRRSELIVERNLGDDLIVREEPHG